MVPVMRARDAAGIGLLSGVLVLAYGAFFAASGAVLCILFGNGRSAFRQQAGRRLLLSGVLLASFFVPTLAWVGFVIQRLGSSPAHDSTLAWTMNTLGINVRPATGVKRLRGDGGRHKSATGLLKDAKLFSARRIMLNVPICMSPDRLRRGEHSSVIFSRHPIRDRCILKDDISAGGRHKPNSRRSQQPQYSWHYPAVTEREPALHRAVALRP